MRKFTKIFLVLLGFPEISTKVWKNASMQVFWVKKNSTQLLPCPNFFKPSVPGGLRFFRAFASLFLQVLLTTTTCTGQHISTDEPAGWVTIMTMNMMIMMIMMMMMTMWLGFQPDLIDIWLSVTTEWVTDVLSLRSHEHWSSSSLFRGVSKYLVVRTNINYHHSGRWYLRYRDTAPTSVQRC